MKYFWMQLILGVVSVIFMYYFQTLEYFTPKDSDNFPNWYNISVVLVLIGLFTQSLVSLTIYIVQKALLYGRNENPPPYGALKWGISGALVIVALLVLNIFHFLTLTWGMAILIVAIIGIVLLK